MNANHCDLVLFLPSLRGGGAERALLGVANALHASGVRVVIALAKAEGPYLREVAEGLTVVDLNARRVATALVPFIRLLCRLRPATVLSGLRHANIVAVLAARFVALLGIRIRVVGSERIDTAAHEANGAPLRARIATVVGRVAYRRADAVVAVSEAIAESLRRELGACTCEIVSIPNPTITPELLTQMADPVPHPWLEDGNGPVLVAAGRLNPQKGFDVLLDAFAQVRARRACRLIVLGKGELDATLRATAESLGVAADVLWAGFHTNPAAWFSRASLFVLSSRAEGLPNVLIQALASGAPVVSTDCRTGPAEILEGGRWGYLVPVEDPDALASAILSALDAPRPLPPASVLRRYSPDAVAERFAKILRVGSAEPRGATSPADEAA